MNVKELVLDFYHSEAMTNSDVMSGFLHDDVLLDWNSSKGFIQLNKKQLVGLSEDMRQAYSSSIIQISHIVQEEHIVSVRYTHYVTTHENPDEIMVLAIFMALWEVREGRLYRGFQMSQLP